MKFWLKAIGLYALVGFTIGCGVRLWLMPEDLYRFAGAGLIGINTYYGVSITFLLWDEWREGRRG